MDYAVTYEELTDFIAKKKEEIANIWTERAVFIRSEPELPAGTVIDREKSVRWNEEEVWHRNNSRKGKLASFQAKINACNKAISEKSSSISVRSTSLPNLSPTSSLTLRTNVGIRADMKRLSIMRGNMPSSPNDFLRQWTCAETKWRKIMSKEKFLRRPSVCRWRRCDGHIGKSG